MAGGKEKPSAKEKRLAARKSVAKETRLTAKKPVAKVGTVANLYAKSADGSSTLIGRKRDRVAAKETTTRRGRPSGSTQAPRGNKHPRARLSSPVPSASSSESGEEEERPVEPEVEEEHHQESDDDYHDRRSGESESEEEEHQESEEEDEDAVADEDLLTAHPLPLVGIPREHKPYLRGPSSMPERGSNGVLDVTGDM